MTINKIIAEMELSKLDSLFKTMESEDFSKDVEILALYNAERLRLYGKGTEITFLDFSQEYIVKQLLQAEIFDRMYSPSR